MIWKATDARGMTLKVKLLEGASGDPCEDVE